jgi:hypothetical protein
MTGKMGRPEGTTNIYVHTFTADFLVPIAQDSASGATTGSSRKAVFKLLLSEDNMFFQSPFMSKIVSKP